MLALLLDRRWRALFWLAGLWLLLFAGTHIPAERMVPLPGKSDLMVHFAAFAGLGAVLLACCQRWFPPAWWHVPLAWLLLAGYAAVDERTQSLVGRRTSLADWLADVLGAATGMACLLFWQRLRRWER